MKRLTARVLALFLVLSMLFGVVACTGLGGDGTDTVTTGTPTSEEPTGTVTGPGSTEPPDALRALPDLATYKIVFGELASDEAEATARALAAAIETATGVTLPVMSDYVPYGQPVPANTREILVGATNRVSAPALRYYDFTVTFADNRLAVLGGSDEALASAVAFIGEYLLDAEESTLSYVPAGYTHTGDYAVQNFTLGGYDIAQYVIVREAAYRECALYLRDVIRELSGVVLPIRTPEEAETPYEFLLGDTGRAAGERAVAAGNYALGQDGAKFVFAGEGDLPYYALIDFVKNKLSGTYPQTYVLTLPRTEVDGTLCGMTATNLPKTLPAITLEYAENEGGVMERFFKTVAELPEEITVLDPVTLADYPLSARNKQLYVAPDGNDEAAGTLEAPLATLTEAVKRMTNVGGGVIWLRGGTYSMANAVNLYAAQGGTPTRPLFIKAYEDETPVLTSYKSLPTEWFDSIDPNDPVASRLPAEAQSYVVYTNLWSHGWTAADLTELVSDSNAYGETKLQTKFGVTPILLIGNTEYEICRYPNADEEPLSYAYAYESGRVTSSTGSEIYYTWLDRVAAGNMLYQGQPVTANTPVPWSITLGTRNETQMKNGVAASATANWDSYAPILDWVDTGNIWYYGRPYSDWDVGAFNVHIGYYDGDLTKPALTSTMPSALGAYTYSSATHGHHYYLFNAIEALDIPGEWFIDVETGNMYIYPTDNFYGEGTISYTGSATGDLLLLSGAKNVVIDGLTIRGAARYGIYAYQTDNLVIENCTISNVGAFGAYIGTSTNLGVIYNDFSVAHGGMLNVSSTRLTNMEPDGNVIQNNSFHDPTANHQIGISVGGMRTVVSHNYLVNTNISMGENLECIIEYNEVAGGSEDVGDGGLIYMYGLYTRGNHVRYNLLHKMNFTGTCVYNDGMCSGNYTYNNMMCDLTGYRSGSIGTQKCYYVSTGHNNVCYNNVMIVRNVEQVRANNNNPTIPYGDSAIVESTLFFNERADGNGYDRNEDSASYSWDALYLAAAKRYTEGNGVINLVKFRERFPNFMDSMAAARALFDLINTEGYDRRTAVLEMEQTTIYTEDFFRQPAYNVYKNNVILGGEERFYDYNADGVTDQWVHSDYLDKWYGSTKSATMDINAKDLRIMENNFYCSDYNDILYDPELFDYNFYEDSLERVREVIPDFKVFDYTFAGLTDY